ncbi:dynamin family protein [Pararobbsia silviterrae]|uniref:Dynamin N-terminal domain-containing protein n=1 Tax=Pararobbsia silviterrae TaxID=1792498 RepID=A0A494XZR6_9BURK|nr:dynamin family protein [Pararobbsia silviterrae]RKP56007.1 hypothetical protein D7S86_12555 [Pararobbsia silviterrae]
MKADATHESRFIAEVDAFEFTRRDVEAVVHALNDWLAALNAALQSHALVAMGLSAQSELIRQADAINATVSETAQTWTHQWTRLQAAQDLADHFDDKALLLVFGKFNAGKSSFCNFLAERFAAHRRAVQYFYVDAGRVIETQEPFKEGSTETTSRLQGVCLGDNLVLLDTPGLHSVTPDNAALTQRFTDSADGVLWLTSSTSPGQVQELDDLGRELHRNKPLMPVVTRSDVYEEDEVDGEIVKCLRNKSAERRALQEDDIRVRAREKLVTMGVEPTLLRPSVSISAYVAREQGQTASAMSEAGFERLYEALLAIAEPALAYKRRKHAEILLHHLEENVLGALERDVSPMLTELDASLRGALTALELQKTQMANALWRSVMPTLPALLDTHAATHDVTAMCRALSESVREAFSREASRIWADYAIEPNALRMEVALESGADFDDVVVEHPGVNGPVCEIAGIDYGRVHAALSHAVRTSVVTLANDAARQCEDTVTQWLARVDALKDLLSAGARGLLELKVRVRSE